MVEFPDVTWEDVGVLENVKHKLQDRLKYSKEHLNKLLKCKMMPCKGALLCASIGCDVTNVAKAFANECQAKFIMIKS